MAYMLGDDGDHDPERLGALIGMFVDGRYGRSSPVLGVDEGSDLGAAALVDPPERGPLPHSYKKRFDRVRSQIGERSWERVVAFGDALKDIGPTSPHHYLGMVGVRTRFRGAGLGRKLVESVIEMSNSHEKSIGVVLSTEAEENLGFYQHMGFEVLGAVKLGDLRSWTLIRPSDDGLEEFLA